MADILQVNTELPADFTPTAPSGLTDEEAASRKPNISHHRPDKSTAQILAENLFTPFNGLNVALAVCLALVGSWRNMLFLGVVVSNTLIGTVQELRARKTIRKLSLLNAPTAHVLRNGQEKTCSPDALVKGDLVILRAGDQVMADAVVTSGQGAANESLLTGESTPMRKQPGDFLLSGSYILEGTFTAQLVYVGDESYAARLTRSAKEIRRPKSVLMTEVNRLIRIVSAALIPIGLLLFCKQFFLQHLPLTTAVPTSVAAMIGMIPEGLILLISVALAVGVIKLGKRNTLVQELYGIETLSRADVLCLDKTGTITTGKMTLDSLLPLSGDEGAMRTQLGRFLSSMDERSGTLDALRAEIPDVQGEKPVAVLPFSSERKKSAVSFADGTTLILGAPTFVLDDAHLAPIRKTLSDCAGRGLRVLVLAEADGCVTETDAPAVTRVIGLCLLTDEIRPAAQETLHYFHTQGVALKIISGDDEKTVAAIARKVGLSGGAVDASTLADNELPDACERYAVFGRVTPTRKKALVEALKAKGHHVAMTGDGVNDIPALKAADCSIAMAGGADAILIPEIPYKIEKVAKVVESRAKSNKGFTIIAVAEGAMTPEEAKMGKKEREAKRAAEHFSSSAYVAQQLRDLVGVEARAVVPGHIQRGGSPNAYDRVLSTQFGVHAAELIRDGVYGVTVALKGNEITHNKLSDIAGVPKLVPPDNTMITTARNIGISFGD